VVKNAATLTSITQEPGDPAVRKATAVWFTSERKAELRPDSYRACGPGDITVQTIASAISAGTELAMYRGVWPTGETVLQLPADAVQPQETMGGSFIDGFPLKYGYASVGRVLEAGVQTNYRVGDLVFARYPHQDFYTVRSEWSFPLPAWDPIEIGTHLALLDVALNALLDARITIGDIVAVYGLGVVGQFIAQLARRTASRVVVIDPLPSRRQLALNLGADVAVTPGDALEAIRDASGGRGADVSIEASGAPLALQTAIEGTGVEGSVVVPGFYTANVNLTLGPEFLMRRIRMIASMANSIDGRLFQRWTIERRLHLAAELLPTLHPTDLISHRFPFENAPEAYRLIDQHPDEVLCVVLVY
jgi:threonine dehydrogenase-like Zn-dependent dehydrogenase